MFNLLQKNQLISPDPTRTDGKMLNFGSRLESPDRMFLFLYDLYQFSTVIFEINVGISVCVQHTDGKWETLSLKNIV